MRTSLVFIAAVSAFAQGRGANNQPPVISQSVRPSGSSLGTIRLGAQDDKIWFGWKVGIPAAAFRNGTFAEAAVKADALGLGSIEGFDTQKISPEIPKPLTYHLLPGERAAVTYKLREVNVKLAAYHVANMPTDADSRRKLFDFAKAMGVETIVTTADAATLPELEKLATDAGVNVAVEKSAASALQGRGKRIGLAIDAPTDVAAIKDRVMVVKVRDAGAKGLADFYLALYRAGVKPLYISVDGTGAADTYADLQKSLAGFEKAMLPAMSARVHQMLDSPEGKIRGPALLPDDMKKQIDAAVPRKAIVQPKKPRKLLVTDVQMYSGHSSIPHGNLMLELIGKYTGAYEPTFSNDPALLKYPKIKEFDAVWFNNVCGMVHPDEDVREGILRYVKEGGGLGGHHAVTYADMNWPEFMDMIGAWAGAHHTEQQVVKIDDPSSPLANMFGGQSFEHTDEFYHFPDFAPYSRQKQHVLLSLDVEKSDMATTGKFCAQCTRADQDYALAWIKSYGKGRVYITPLGHTNAFYTEKPWTQHVLAALQFVLGDLDADTTPSAKVKK